MMSEQTTVVLRPYQQELSDSLVRNNGGLVYLPTGAGKTYICADVASRYFQKCRDEAPHNVRRFVLMLVPTTALVSQQAAVVRKYLNQKDLSAVAVIALEGSKLRHFTLAKNVPPSSTPGAVKGNVFTFVVGTAQAVVNALAPAGIDPPPPDVSRSKLFLQDVGMIIFDEAHHCGRNHPFAVLSRRIDSSSGVWLIGVSASLVYAKFEDKIIKHIASLCDLLHITSSSVFRVDMAQLEREGYHRPSKTERVDFDFSRHCHTVEILRTHELVGQMFELIARSDEQINGMTREIYDCILNLETCIASDHVGFGKPFTELVRILAEGGGVRDFQDLQNEGQKMWSALVNDARPADAESEDELHSLHNNLVVYLHLMDVLHLLIVTKQSSLELGWRYLSTDARKDLGRCPVTNELTRLVDNGVGNFEECEDLFQYLRLWYEESDGREKAIVFVEHRLTTEILANFLNTKAKEEIDEDALGRDKSFAVALYGKGRKCGNFIGEKLSPTTFKERLELFRTEGGPAVLVSTQAAEEGVDIAICSRVIHFDPPTNPVSHAQRTGRARQVDSESRVLNANVDALDDALRAQDAIITTRQEEIDTSIANIATATSNQQRAAAQLCNARKKLAELDDSAKSGKVKLSEYAQKFGLQQPTMALHSTPSQQWVAKDGCFVAFELRSGAPLTVRVAGPVKGTNKKAVEDGMCDELFKALVAQCLGNNA